jgi:hypothetical protein
MKQQATTSPTPAVVATRYAVEHRSREYTTPETFVCCTAKDETAGNHQPYTTTRYAVKHEKAGKT